MIVDDFGSEDFQEIRDAIGFASTNMLARDLTLDEAAPWYQDFTDAMRAHALLWLLAEADTDTCFRDLTVSGQVRRHFLRRAHLGNATNALSASSRMEPLLDVVAAGSLDVARDIATLSPIEWLRDDEYEDDFCYARFLHLWVSAPDDVDAMANVLDRFERALEGADSPRLDVCRSLLARDHQGFYDAFAALLAERQDVVAARERRMVGDPVLVIESQVFVEGLAILRLADDLGFRTESEYPGCPRLARSPTRDAPWPDTLPPP